MTTTLSKGRVELAGDQAKHSDTVSGLARAGFVARGLMYGIVAVLALRVGFGHGREQADRDGALQAIARQRFGSVLLVLLAIGFGGFALWHGVRAATVRDGGASAAGKRALNAGRAVLYGALSVSTVSVLASPSSRGGGNEQEQGWTARVLGWPFGRPLVVVIGVAIVVAGAWQGWRGLSGRWEKKLDLGGAEHRARRAITWIARVGFTGRMVVMVLIGAFLVRAAVQFDPSEAEGVDGALRRVAQASYGSWLLLLVAAGLAAYAVFSFVEARYRRVEDG